MDSTYQVLLLATRQDEVDLLFAIVPRLALRDRVVRLSYLATNLKTRLSLNQRTFECDGWCFLAQGT